MTEPEREYLTGLNDKQKEAVLATDGPLLILAGAGSGKTRVLTHRIVHLIHEGVAPSAILAVTFTNKAGKEMRERALNLIRKYPPSNRAHLDSTPTITTFHSLGVRLLREFHDYLHLPKHFTIYDRSDSLRATKQAVEKANYNPKEFEPRKILGQISRAKGDGISVLEFKDRASNFPEEVAATVYEHYENILHEEKALDFDDLLVKTLSLLRDHPPVRNILHQRYKYIHIDEYQDTNAVQFSIAKALTGEARNLCVVGDIDQNIYSWRGANIKNVLQFEREFPGATTVLLEENYRSTKTIIAVSNEIIDKNKNRIPKTVFTQKEVGEKVGLYVAMTGQDEAEYIAMKAQSLVKEGCEPSDIAVLYRTNFQSRLLEEAFLNFSVPYQLLGTKFFERKEVKDILSYLRLALNQSSTGDLVRVINEPARGIGKVTVLKIVEGKEAELNAGTRNKIESFRQIISAVRNTAETKPISETLKYILKHSGIEEDLRKQGTEEDLARLENIQELVTLSKRYDELPALEGAEALMENAALQSDQDELKDKEEQNAVRLMTIHAAKGLEFPYVFICGLEEGLFPHERLDDTGIDHEEERRLFYVALTRAEKKLFLSYAHMRTIYGSQRINLPSSFLNDISIEHVENENPGGASGYETTIYLD